MKTNKSISFVIIRTLWVAALLMPAFSVSAQERGVGADSSASVDATTQTKVDAGNALNAFSEAKATDPADSDDDGYDDPYIREGGRTVDAGNIPEKLQQQNHNNEGDGSTDEAKSSSGDLTPIYPPKYPSGGSVKMSDGDVDEDGHSDATVSKPDRGGSNPNR